MLQIKFCYEIEGGRGAEKPLQEQQVVYVLGMINLPLESCCHLSL